MNDQQLIRKIKALRNIKPRSEWVTLNRDFLRRQIKAEQTIEPLKIGWFEFNQVVFGTIAQRVFQPAVAMLLLLSVSFGSSLVANAAFYSLPGDSLYRVKIALEKTQLAVTPNEDRKAELKMAFAHNRVKEFNKIIAQTDVNPTVKKERINLVVKEFQKNVTSVQAHINKIAQDSDKLDDANKEKTLRIALSLSSETQELAQSFDEQASSLSEGEKTAVEEIVAQAIESAQKTSLSAQELVAQASAAAPEEQSEAQATTTETGLESEIINKDNNPVGPAETSTSEFINPLFTEPNFPVNETDSSDIAENEAEVAGESTNPTN